MNPTPNPTPEPEYSPAPGTPQTATKAYVSAGLAALTAFVAYWIADVDPFTKKEVGEAALLALAASGVTGGGTFFTKNKPKRAKRPDDYR